MMKKITIFAVFLFGFLTTAGFSQHNGYDRYGAELEKTDHLLLKAKEAVIESGSERAKNILQVGFKIQKMAKRVTESDFTPLTMNQGMKYTLSAREKAQRAIAVTRQAEENEDFVHRRLEKTGDMIRRVEERISAETPVSVRFMLDSAHEKHKRAIEFFRNRRLKASLHLTMQAEKSVQKIIERIGGYANAQQRYQSLIDRYYALMERIEFERYDSHPEFAQRLVNAEKLKTEAESLAMNGEFAKAEKKLQRSVEILSRIAENVREPAKIENAMENLNRKVEDIREKVFASGDDHAKRLYSDVQKHLSKASAFHQNGNHDAAVAQLQAARQLLSRLLRRLGEKG